MGRRFDVNTSLRLSEWSAVGLTVLRCVLGSLEINL
jgi:hypothetical protein